MTSEGAITSKIKHAIKHTTSPARIAQLLQPSLAFCLSLQPMTAHCNSCRTCFKVLLHVLFYLWSLLKWIVVGYWPAVCLAHKDAVDLNDSIQSSVQVHPTRHRLWSTFYLPPFASPQTTEPPWLALCTHHTHAVINFDICLSVSFGPRNGSPTPTNVVVIVVVGVLVVIRFSNP